MGSAGDDPRTAPKKMPPLTIRKIDTLNTRLDNMEGQAMQAAANTQQKATVTIKINGAEVQSVVTPPTHRKGRFYRLFYVNGKRVAKGDLAAQLLA
jgi:hypothetical protein